MTTTSLADIENQLPNGFHDALVRTVSVDYVAREATFAMDIDVSEVSGAREMRPAVLSLDGLAYLVIEPPDASYPFAEGEELRVDLCETRGSAHLPPRTPEAFAASFFVNEWNAFIHFEARAARFEWQDASPPRDR